MAERRPCMAVLFSVAGNEIARVPTWDTDLPDNAVFGYCDRLYLASEIWFTRGLMFVDMHELVIGDLRPRQVSDQQEKQSWNLVKPVHLPMHSMYYLRLGTHKMSIAIRGNSSEPFSRPGAAVPTSGGEVR